MLALFALFGFNPQALAATQTWTGNTDANWADANWSTGVPAITDTALFNGAGNSNTTISLGTSSTVGNIIFSTPSAAAYTIGSGGVGSQTLVLGDSGSITVNAGVANNQLFNSAITLGTDATAQSYTFTNNSLTNNLTFAGNIAGGAGGTAGTETLTITGVGNTLFGGNLNKGGATNINLAKDGSGTFTVDPTSNSGSVSGTVTVNDGTLAINFTNAGSNGSLLSSFSAFTLAGGTLQIVGNGSNISTQVFGGVTSNSGYDVVTLGTDTPTLTMAAFTQNLGSQTVFYGPAYYNGATTSGVTTPTANVLTSGTITTTTVGTNANLLWAAARIATATVGLYNWASATTTAGTHSVLSGDQVTGFYTQELNNATLADNDLNFDLLGNAKAANVGGSGSFKTDSYADTIRFNVAGAYTFTTAVGGSNGDSEVGGILVTPNVGANNTTIASGGAYISAASPQSGTVSAMDVYQNNTKGELLFNVPFQNPWNGSNFSDAGSYVQGGLGTVVLTGESTSDLQTGATYLNGGTTVINDNSQLGKVSSNIALNLNGGTVLGSAASLSLATRGVVLGGTGGGLAAVNGDTMTVGGNITGAAGTGPLVIGIPASSANGSVAGLLPGTGTGTANAAAVYATGEVLLTGANTYYGGTVLDSGTLNFTALTQIGGSNYGGVTLNGGALQYGTSNTADISTGASVTILAPGGTIDVNNNAVTYANSIGNYGSGSLTVASTTAGGSLTLSAASTFTGGLTDGAGATVNINAPTAITGAVSLSGTANLGASATLSSPASLTLVGGAALNLNGQTISTGAFSGANSGATIASAGSGGSLTVNQGGATNTFAGVISGASFNFATAGTGTTILSGLNTYTGTTTVGGTSILQVNGGTGNLGTGAITVNNGATLNAQGAFALNGSSLTLNTGGGFSTVDGSINPVTFTGSLNLNGTTTTPDSLSFDLSSTGSGSATGDLLSVTGINFAGGSPETKIFGTGLASGSTLTSGTAAEVLYVPGATLTTADFAVGGSGIITLGSGLSATSYHESLGVGVGADSGAADALYIDLSLYQTRFYWTGNGTTTPGSWNDETNFATDHTGATPATTDPITAASNIFLTADGNLSSNYTETLDNFFTINSLNFTGVGSGAASHSVTLAPGTGGPANYLIIEGSTTYGNPNSGVSYAAGTGLAVEAGSDSHTISANIELGNSQVWAINNSSADPLLVSGTISNVSSAAGITKTGTGTLILSANNTYSGGTTVYGGLLQLGAANALLSTGALTVSGTGSGAGASAGTLDLAGNNQTVGSLSDSGTSTGTITDSTGSATLTDNNSTPNSYSGTVTDTVGTTGGTLGVTVSGGSSLTLSGANSYDGSTIVTSGTLIAGNNAALGNVNSSSGGLILNPSMSNTAAADFTSSTPSIASLTGTGNVVLGGTSGSTGSATALTVGGTPVLSGTLTGVVSDLSATKSSSVGSLTLNSGYLALNGADTFTGSITVTSGTLALINTNAAAGATTVNGGSLLLGNANSLASSSVINLAGGSLGFINGVTTSNILGIEGTSNISLNNNLSTGVALNINGTSGTYSETGVITGAGSVTLNNTGISETFGNASGVGAANYSGGTTVNGGSLTISGTSTQSGANASLTLNGGTLILAGTSSVISSGGAAVNITGHGGTNIFTVENNATINTNGGLTFDNYNNDYATAITATIENNASVTVGEFNWGNGTDRVQGSTLSPNSLTIDPGASLIVTGSFNMLSTLGNGTSPVVNYNLSGGDLQVQNFVVAGNNANSTVTMNFNGGTITSGASDGANGTTYFFPNLTGNKLTANDVGGGTGVTFNTNGYTDTILQPIVHSGSGTDGGLTKTGAGTLILSDTNTYNGATTVAGGTLSLDTTTPFAAGSKITFTGGTLQFTSVNTTDYSGNFANSTSPIALDTQGHTLTFSTGIASTNTGGLTLGNSGLTQTGSLALAANESYTGPTTVNQGTLILNNGVTLSDTVITVNTGATFEALGGNTIGATGLGGLDLAGGSNFSIVDSASGTVTLSGASLTDGLTVGGGSGVANLNFEINGTSSSDELIVSGAPTNFLGAGGKIYISDIAPGTTPSQLTYTLITSTGGIAVGAGDFQLGTGSIGIGTTTYLLSLANSTSTALVLTLTAASPESLYWDGNGSLHTSWSDITDFTTDSAGMHNAVLGTDAVSAVANIFETASGASHFSQTLDNSYSINSLDFTGAATSPITIAAGTGGSGSTLTIQATAGFTGATTYNPGTGLVVEAGSAAHTISANMLLGNSQTWELDGSSPLTVSGSIANGGASDSLTLIGAAGTLILTNTNSYSGGTVVAGNATLQEGITNALLPTAGLTVSGTGALDLHGFNQTVSGLSDGGVSTGTITATTGNSTLTDNNNAAFGVNTYSGLISGSLGVTKTGNGALVLSNPSPNTYTGPTNVTGGTLVAANNYALGNSTSVVGGLTLASTGSVDFTSANPHIASLSGTGSGVVLGSNANSSSTTLNVGDNGATTTYAGVISDEPSGNTSAYGNLNLTGGQLTLTGNNTFTGATTVSGGTLVLGTPLALQDSTLYYNNQGGVFSWGTQTSATLGGLSGAENLALTNGGNAVALNIGSSGESSVYTGNLSGLGSLTMSAATANNTIQIGSGSTGGATYTGATTVNGGNLIIGGTSSLTGAITASGAINASHDTITFQDTAVVNSSSPLQIVGNNGSGNAQGSAAVTISGNASVTVPSVSFGNGLGRVPTGNSLTLNGGTLDDTGAFTLLNSVAGTSVAAGVTVNLNGGLLETEYFNEGNVGSGATTITVNLNGSTVQPLESTTSFLPALTGESVKVGGSGAIFNTNGFNITVGAALTHGSGSPDGGLTVSGNSTGDTLTLTAANTYTGPTTINSGATLQLGTGASGQDGTITSSNGITDDGTLIYNRNGTPASGVAIGGSGNVEVEGSGSQTLSAASSYTGTTTVTGTLIVSGALNGTTALNVNGGTAELSAADSLNSSAPITLASGTLDVVGNQSLDTLASSGASTLTLGTASTVINLADSGGATWTGTLSIDNWTGLGPDQNPDAGAGDGYDQILFAADDLTTAQLNAVIFVDPTVDGITYTSNFGAVQLSDGELVAAIPEPGTWGMLMAGAGMLVVWQRNRRKS